MFDDMFDTDWIGDAGEYIPSDTADLIGGAIGDAGGYSGGYDDILNGSILDSVQTDFFPSLDDLGGMSIEDVLTPEIMQIAENNGGITGVPFIDKILGGLKSQWDKDPLAMIGAGVGILGKLDQIRASRKNGGAEPGTMVPGGPQAQQLIAGNNQRVMDMVGGMHAPGPTLDQIRIPIANAPTGRDPGLFITQAPELGALSKFGRK